MKTKIIYDLYKLIIDKIIYTLCLQKQAHALCLM